MNARVVQWLVTGAVAVALVIGLVVGGMAYVLWHEDGPPAPRAAVPVVERKPAAPAAPGVFALQPDGTHRGAVVDGLALNMDAWTWGPDDQEFGSFGPLTKEQLQAQADRLARRIGAPGLDAVDADWKAAAFRTFRHRFNGFDVKIVITQETPEAARRANDGAKSLLSRMGATAFDTRAEADGAWCFAHKGKDPKDLEDVMCGAVVGDTVVRLSGSGAPAENGSGRAIEPHSLIADLLRAQIDQLKQTGGAKA
ncbi:hypothetical protein [Yinghuangia seranimata]|uniref:hypothetical protein n=1 Tax=Yinghuangia seranimata TaxID=408067 RepID=UPI00248BD971|nr:hypothetical protein [Yinghuangia seranimata]MDI2129355.1 hypothetical protein [Yinghuangia seranimata]